MHVIECDVSGYFYAKRISFFNMNPVHKYLYYMAVCSWVKTEKKNQASDSMMYTRAKVYICT